ncbi:leucine-rich alpha-2-glycoprotein-like isoform X2 [Mugil cephalus]|nr:leucine-rich alpha-2-glycoprotein-like isoform X2 [Mugil cephalus]
MNLWLLLTFAALLECGCQKRGVYSCPDLCSCSFPPSGAEVVCSQSSLVHFPVDGLPPNTTKLSIQSTNLSSIAASHLSVVPLLDNLQLYHNNLTNLSAELLSFIPHLKTLDLTGNRLVHLPPNIFSHALLHSLVLKNNQFEEADVAWFPFNSSLASLDLSGNRLSSVPAALFQRLPGLTNLDLSFNNLQELHEDHLKDLCELETLNLMGNKLTVLKPATFTHNLKLSHLFLQENRLQELPATLLHGLQHLELLMLNQNQLRHLPPGLLDEKKDPFLIIMSLNPWECDEDMEYLWRWITTHPQNVLFLEDVTCSSPEALKNQQVASLTSSQLGLKNI